MKYILLFLPLIVLFSCNDSRSVKREKYSGPDSINGMSAEEWKQHYIDSTKKEITNRVYFDTVGVAIGPVKVLKVKMLQREYSTYRDINITYQNVSDKKIAAIKFRWHGENAFGDPADMGGMERGFGGGFTDSGLKAGKTTNSEWSILSRDGRTAYAWPTEVVFEDGTKWKSQEVKD